MLKDISTDNLRLEFLHRFITTDETWVHHYTPESEEQFSQLQGTVQPAQKKAKVALFFNKVMATVFQGTCGIIFINYLQKGKTINGECYVVLLQRLSETGCNSVMGWLPRHLKIFFWLFWGGWGGGISSLLISPAFSNGPKRSKRWWRSTMTTMTMFITAITFFLVVSGTKFPLGSPHDFSLLFKILKRHRRLNLTRPES